MFSFPSHHAFLAVAVATHAVVGYALGSLLLGGGSARAARTAGAAGAVGAVLADLDLLFPPSWGWPLVHRGLTHTLLAAGVCTAVVAARHRRLGAAVGVGYASQLLLDATTPTGVPLLYPLVDHSVHLPAPVGAHAPLPTALLWLACLAALALRAAGR